MGTVWKAEQTQPVRRIVALKLIKEKDYANGMALTAYYCGFAGLITILGSIALLKAQIPQPNSRMVFVLLFAGGGFLAFLANLFGILGLRIVTINPDAKGTGHAVTGLVMGVLEIIGLLALLLFSLQAGDHWLSLRPK